MGYSVISEPAISVVFLDGERRSLGIRETMIRAHEIKDVVGETPLERYAVLRLLIVLAMDMCALKSSDDRVDLLDAGAFNADRFDHYIAMCERDGPRFDLFDKEHPFLQSPFRKELDQKAEKPVAVLFHALPSGNNHVFLDHRLAEEHAVSYERAFQALCASYVFCVSGTAGPSSVNNTPPVYTTLLGSNLYETIVWNMLSESEVKPLEYGLGNVPWRTFRDVIPKQEVPSVRLLEGLTWMPRRITLIPEDGKVCKVYCQAGLNFKGNDLWNDPYVPRFKKKDETYGTVKPELGRAFWRDIGTVLYDHDGKAVRQPQNVRCMFNLYDEDEIPIWIPIRAVALVTNQAAYTGWQEDELTLPAVLLHEEDKASLFRLDLSTIESIQSSLYTNVQRYVDKPRASAKTSEHEIAQQCQNYFLHLSQAFLFGTCMDEIVSGVDLQEHANHFFEGIQNILQETFQQVLHKAGRDSKSLTSQINAEKWIWFALAKIKNERIEKDG